ncbi:MAG: hypothetical protein FWD44_09195 [Oscillospiraceae bacterium]|nr:hypothetical protein [Oscillospiraceae bacterium]
METERLAENFEAMMTWLEDKFGMFGLLIPALTIIVGTLLFFFIIVKVYGGWQKRTYGFRMFINWPGLIVMLFYAVASLMKLLDGTENFTQAFLVLLLVGAPGMICYFVICIKDTRNILVTIINVILMYILYMLMGYILGVIILFICGALGIMLLIAALSGGARENAKANHQYQMYQSDRASRRDD